MARNVAGEIARLTHVNASVEIDFRPMDLVSARENPHIGFPERSVGCSVPIVAVGEFSFGFVTGRFDRLGPFWVVRGG